MVRQRMVLPPGLGTCRYCADSQYDWALAASHTKLKSCPYKSGMVKVVVPMRVRRGGLRGQLGPFVQFASHFARLERTLWQVARFGGRERGQTRSFFLAWVLLESTKRIGSLQLNALLRWPNDALLPG